MKRLFLFIAAASLVTFLYLQLRPPPMSESSSIPVFRKAVYEIPEHFTPIKALSTVDHSISQFDLRRAIYYRRPVDAKGSNRKKLAGRR